MLDFADRLIDQWLIVSLSIMRLNKGPLRVRGENTALFTFDNLSEKKGQSTSPCRGGDRLRGGGYYCIGPLAENIDTGNCVLLRNAGARLERVHQIIMTDINSRPRAAVLYIHICFADKENSILPEKALALSSVCRKKYREDLAFSTD